MSDIIEIELNKVCRTCLTASEDMKSLYEASASVSETLADRLMSNTPLTCYSNDGLPTRICVECITDLNRLCTFKSKCLKSEEILQNYASYLTTFYKSKEAPLQVCWSTSNLIKFEENARNKTHNYVNPDHIITVTEMKNQLHNEIDLELNMYENAKLSTKTQDHLVKTPEKTALVKGKPFSCTVCSSSFNRKDVLRTHMRTHTGKKPYPCPVCNRAFRNKNNMTVHMRTHTGEKPYSCHQCDRSFTHKSDVKKHTRIHTGEKPYTCTVCEKSFSYTHHLKNHMRSHTGAKPYACKDCNSSFSCSAGLKYHMMTHTGVRPFECKLCDRAFYRQDTLTVHLRTHTGEKPFACTFCDKTFSNKTNVTAHTRTHTKEIPYLCSVCGLSFQRSDILTKHMLTHSV